MTELYLDNNYWCLFNEINPVKFIGSENRFIPDKTPKIGYCIIILTY